MSVRELTVEEYEMVSGGGWFDDLKSFFSDLTLAYGITMGGHYVYQQTVAWAAAQGITLSGIAWVAGSLTLTGVAAGAAFYAGWQLGTGVYNVWSNYYYGGSSGS